MKGLPCASFSASSRLPALTIVKPVMELGPSGRSLVPALEISRPRPETAHVNGMGLGCLKPFAPGCHDFRRRLFKSVMQQHIFLHARPLFQPCSSHGSLPQFAPGGTRRRSARSNRTGSLRTSAIEPLNSGALRLYRILKRYALPDNLQHRVERGLQCPLAIGDASVDRRARAAARDGKAHRFPAMGNHDTDVDVRHGGTLRNRVKAKHYPVGLERVARRRRKQKSAAPSDQLPDRGLDFPADLRQLVHLCIGRTRQYGAPDDVALDQGSEARCQQGRCPVPSNDRADRQIASAQEAAPRMIRRVQRSPMISAARASAQNCG